MSQLNLKVNMTSKIAPTALCKIIAPAHPTARGRVVTVLRLAVGQPDIDGVAFIQTAGRRAVWVVKALHEPIPWGDANVNVFAIAEECLSVLSKPVAAPEIKTVARTQQPIQVTA